MRTGATQAVPSLLATPVMVCFISAEPPPGPINLDLQWLSLRLETDKGRLDWVIVGGESGARHRPMDLNWVRALRDQCLAARAALFLEQVGGRTPKAGQLDGRTWDQMPDPVGIP